MSNGKIIGFSFQNGILVHTVKKRVTDFQKDCGLWIIYGVAALRGECNGFKRTKQRKYEFYSISHLHDGRGKIWCENGTEQEVPAGSVVIITPGTINRYGGWNDEPYIEDYICFAGPIADGWKRAGLISDGFSNFGLERKLLPIIELARDPSNESQARAALLLQNILFDIHAGKMLNLAANPLEKIILEIKSHPENWWTVEQLAEKCNTSVSQFRRNFKKRTGMLPKEYIEELKLRHAADVLLSTQHPIKEVASQFGYRDPFHFSRRFKHRFGVAPETYRLSPTSSTA